MPGGEIADMREGARPIDLSHLARRTSGDRELERELLTMFAEQAKAAGRQVARANVRERRILARTLSQSARDVGALAIAHCAAAMDTHPSDMTIPDTLARLIDEACDFIASIDR